jgi:hypothetical protein
LQSRNRNTMQARLGRNGLRSGLAVLTRSFLVMDRFIGIAETDNVLLVVLDQ